MKPITKELNLTNSEQRAALARLNDKECCCSEDGGLNHCCDIHGDLDENYLGSYDVIIPLIKKCLITEDLMHRFTCHVPFESAHYTTPIDVITTLTLSPEELAKALLLTMHENS